jgi:hypothetical protein
LLARCWKGKLVRGGATGTHHEIIFLHYKDVHSD